MKNPEPMWSPARELRKVAISKGSCPTALCSSDPPHGWPGELRCPLPKGHPGSCWTTPAPGYRIVLGYRFHNLAETTLDQEGKKDQRFGSDVLGGSELVGAYVEGLDWLNEPNPVLKYSVQEEPDIAKKD